MPWDCDGFHCTSVISITKLVKQEIYTHLAAQLPLHTHQPKSSWSYASRTKWLFWSVSTLSWVGAGSGCLTHVGTRRLAGLSSRSGWCLAAAFISHAASGSVHWSHTHLDLSFISSDGRASCGRGSGVQHPNGPAGDQQLFANLNQRDCVETLGV